jgi:single-stranded-DNA-specific exonuclease
MVVAEAPADRAWTVAPAAPQALVAALPELHPVAVQVLHTRGLTTAAAIRAFLHQDQLHDPLALYGMDRAVARLRLAIAAQERIAAHGDFDVDGISAAAILVEGLTAAGARVTPFLPVRSTTGYGVHASAVDKLAADGVTLIVTGDTGTRAMDAVKRASELGIDVIVTDHHLPGETLPAAHALVNPHQTLCSYPFKELSGAGVAWKLIDALSRSVPFNGLASEDLLDLVALGTIVDVSPLIGENRWLVRRGLERLAQSRRPGIQALLAQANREGALDERTVAFSIGPRLNAAGRMESADLSYELLTTRDHGRAFELVQRLEAINQSRQQLTERVLAEAREQAERTRGQPVLVVRGREWPAGVLGLVAARLSDEYSRPAIVVDVGPEASRGSGRASGSDLDLVALLGECGDLLLEYGGHAQAAGFALASEHVDALAERLVAACADRPDPARTPVIADHRLGQADLDWPLHHGLRLLRPFGQANPAPLFLSEAVPIVEARPIGAGGKHLRMRLRFGRQTVTAFGPNLGSRADALASAPAADVLFCVESSTWNGTDSLELRLQDARGAAPNL